MITEMSLQLHNVTLTKYCLKNTTPQEIKMASLIECSYKELKCFNFDEYELEL